MFAQEQKSSSSTNLNINTSVPPQCSAKGNLQCGSRTQPWGYIVEDLIIYLSIYCPFRGTGPETMVPKGQTVNIAVTYVANKARIWN